MGAEGNKPLTRKQECVNFLESIDQFGQYESVYTQSIPDPGENSTCLILDVVVIEIHFY